MKFKYAFIDFDGTIANSEPGVKKCLYEGFDAIGLERPSDERVHEMIGPPFTLSMKMFYDLEGEVVQKMISAYRGKYDKDGYNDLKFYDGIEEMLSILKNNGCIVALATSKPKKFSRKIIEEFGYSRFFDYVGGAECDGKNESKKDVIVDCIKNLNVSNLNEVVMIGDRLYDIDGAKEMGLKSIGVLWGFGSREELESHGADYVFETPKEVANFVISD